jgi:hypothetical protein
MRFCDRRTGTGGVSGGRASAQWRALRHAAKALRNIQLQTMTLPGADSTTSTSPSQHMSSELDTDG